jgi:hypothetical protein
LTTVLGDAIPRYIQANPAQRQRGKGRKGQRPIEHREQAEKVWATPLQVLLIAEWLAVLTGRDEDFLLGMRWSETVGLAPDYVLPDYTDGDALDVQWKLYELGGHFYRGRPKDGSIRPAEPPRVRWRPPFLDGRMIFMPKQYPKGRPVACPGGTRHPA